MEWTNSPVANSGGVGDDDYDDMFTREEEDTGEEGNINIPRLAKKSRAETKQMSDYELFLYFQELLDEESTSGGVATLHPSSEPTKTQEAPSLLPPS